MLRNLKSVRGTPEHKRPGSGSGLRLAERYCEVRFATEALCDPLAPEDVAVQSTPEASPVKWHLAHTSWFFEKLVLAEAQSGYQNYDAAYDYLFNSYYESQGERQPRARRGTASRPTTEEIFDYRRHIDAHVLALICRGDDLDPQVAQRIAVGLHHEQQHQELILTDIKHALATNPLRSPYREPPCALDASVLCTSQPAQALRWHRFPTTIAVIGAAGESFCFDNEQPQHQALVHAFDIAGRPVSCGEYAAFIEAGGYSMPELWLADGWQKVQSEAWDAPLYWELRDGKYWLATLAGARPLTNAEPVCHVSYYEADAYARWAGARLPTEQEWEMAAAGVPVEGNFVETGVLHPLAPAQNDDPQGAHLPCQMFGDVWEWTQSAYAPYPGFRPWPGALGEYNAKFMCNQMVLRGGSCVTPRSHMRATYRNFLPPDARWQFSGIRLARSAT